MYKAIKEAGARMKRASNNTFIIVRGSKVFDNHLRAYI
jgi:hypothetical protein